jgi:DNA-binding CsgD family transcriptional regulator
VIPLSSTGESLAVQEGRSAVEPGKNRAQVGIERFIRLPVELTDRLFEEAERRDTTLAEVVRDLVEASLPAAGESATVRHTDAGPAPAAGGHHEAAAQWRAVAQADQAAGAAPRGPRARPSTGWESLTRAEHAVAKLVADGLVYREVGERLFISRRTVETHVAHMFRKLGVSSRRELTALVRRYHQDGAKTADHLGQFPHRGPVD